MSVKPSGIMKSIYSEGLDSEKSRPLWNQLTSSVCILCAYCNLQFLKKVILASLCFQTPINCPRVCFESLAIKELSQSAGETARIGENLDCALPEHNFAPVKQAQEKERY